MLLHTDQYVVLQLCFIDCLIGYIICSNLTIQ